MTSDPKEVLASCRSLFAEGAGQRACESLRILLRKPGTSPDTFQKGGRLLAKYADVGIEPRPVRIRLFGECTLTWLKNALSAVALRDGMRVSVSEAAYDNIVQEIASLEDDDVPDVAILVPWSGRLLDAESEATQKDIIGNWTQAWSLLIGAGCRRVVQVGYDWMRVGSAGYNLGCENGDITKVRAINTALRDQIPDGVNFLDMEAVSAVDGRKAFYDARRYYWTKQPYSEAGLLRLAEHLSAALRAGFSGPKKVLVLDLDNTLWGGVVGEVGATGVAVGDGPEGEAFTDFQRFAKSLGERGILLAVATKNNPEDAREPFEVRRDMPLTLDEFVVFEASWEPKYKSVERIAKQLNLGLDSFVFFDDNPVEREEMRIHLPDVSVVEVPEDPAYYVDALGESLLFETGTITETDLGRATLYKDEAKRRDFQQRADSVHEYLRSLEMRAVIEKVTLENITRVEQLLMRTNQFNLTNRRLAKGEIETLLSDERSISLTVSLRDRFGDYGLVSVILGVPEGESCRIHVWVMSCRVMGRGVEYYLLGEFLKEARELGYNTIVGEFIASKKNAPVAEMYPSLGLSPYNSGDSASHLYKANISTLQIAKHFVTAGVSGSSTKN